MSEYINMTNDKFKKFEYIQSKLKIDPSDIPLSLSQLHLIEKKIGNKLPELARYLFTKSGLNQIRVIEDGSGFGNIELYGFTANIKNYPDYLPETLESISHFYQEPYDFPKHILPFGYSLSSMSPYCFDLSEMKDEDCPVYWYDFYVSSWATPGRVKNYFWSESMVSDYPEKIADTFEEFVMMYLEKRLWKL